jgi:hypothetical protein
MGDILVPIDDNDEGGRKGPYHLVTVNCRATGTAVDVNVLAIHENADMYAPVVGSLAHLLCKHL